MATKQDRERRRIEAEKRQEEYDKLSIEEKISQLDKMFGVGGGAKRQRKKLAHQLSLRAEEKQKKEERKVKLSNKTSK